MQEIFFSHKEVISFDDKGVYSNGEKLEEDQENSDSLKTAKDESYYKTKSQKLMRQKYSAIISRQYENIVVLTGAGSSVSFGGKLMSGLWESIKKEITYDALKEFADKINFNEIEEFNTDLEKMLSHASMYHSVNSDDVTASDMIKNIKRIIREECSFVLPEESPHLLFLKKLTSRKLKYSRPKIFTLNYDTLFEQAASKGGYTVIDGFSFSSPRRFNGIYFDYDIVARTSHKSISDENYIPNVLHIYKPHGSIDWEESKSEDKTYSEGFVQKNEHTEFPLMIYPSSVKYETSYQQPFFEMMSRLQQEIRNKNTLLLIIGFSFGDSHIEAMINEALNVNTSLTVMVVSPDILKYVNDEESTVNDEGEVIDYKYEKLLNKVKSTGNITLVSETFSDYVDNYPFSSVYNYSQLGEE
ncbi:SIR2 family protein [Enterococcus pingfangensis]